MKLGLDTGFFVRLLEASPRALEVWRRVAAGEVEAAISCVTLYELERLGLRGAIARSAARTLAAELPHVCDVAWLDGADLLRRAARVAHGNGLSMADSLILASLVAAGAETVYTTDSDFQRYEERVQVVLL